MPAEGFGASVWSAGLAAQAMQCSQLRLLLLLRAAASLPEMRAAAVPHGSCRPDDITALRSWRLGL